MAKHTKSESAKMAGKKAPSCQGKISKDAKKSERKKHHKRG
jgi:hypothetical protein